MRNFPHWIRRQAFHGPQRKHRDSTTCVAQWFHSIRWQSDMFWHIGGAKVNLWILGSKGPQKRLCFPSEKAVHCFFLKHPIPPTFQNNIKSAVLSCVFFWSLPFISNFVHQSFPHIFPPQPYFPQVFFWRCGIITLRTYDVTFPHFFSYFFAYLWVSFHLQVAVTGADQPATAEVSAMLRSRRSLARYSDIHSGHENYISIWSFFCFSSVTSHHTEFIMIRFKLRFFVLSNSLLCKTQHLLISRVFYAFHRWIIVK